MPKVRDILARKGHAIVSVAPSATVRAAAALMNERGVGGLLVVDETKQLLGVFTERDILRRVVVTGLDPETTLVAEVQTTDVVTCLPDTGLDECSVIMTKRRIRHLPVADADTVYGVITIGDVLAYRIAEQESTIQYLNGYMFGTR
jgi:CBS domain-containing protein